MANAGEPKQQPKLVTYTISPTVKMAMAAVAGDPKATIPLIITLTDSDAHPEEGIGPAQKVVLQFISKLDYDTHLRKSDFYVFASLKPDDIQKLSELDEVHRIWLDEKCQAHVLQSCETVKATACWRTFDANGRGITWAVMDTGIRYDHPHFQQYANIDRQLSKNFSSSASDQDKNGHGTHVAGIIAGAAPKLDKGSYNVATFLEDENTPNVETLDGLPSGVAPQTKLINLKVLDDDATGSASMAILGLEYLRKINQASRDIRVDGVNMSLGYPFEPKVYGCGHSPLCAEVRRAVGAGIVVVVSCGNSGYGAVQVEGRPVPIYLNASITDPANAAEAIAVGSVHKSAPHTYGVSYFSSKGPTGDGRMKPDLVAPGEKVISCALPFDDPKQPYHYIEKSGTSAAAPHVSGAIAAFLSVHREFRGDPDAVKEVFMKSATDLGRQPNFQGAGLVDVMRAMTSV
jgi:subtilisin family serine protease